MKFITSQTLTAALPGLCTTIIQMGRGVIPVSARKTLKMLSSMMKSCRNPTMSYNSSSSEEQESDALSFGRCPYIYYSNIVNNRYIDLPKNISDLNDVFCAPLNRGGWLCKDCIDGFGTSVVSIGYTCANCTENNYGWVLYILSEFFPATIFYFVVLTLRVRITSVPMNCFVMFSQLLVTALKHNAGIYGTMLYIPS